MHLSIYRTDGKTGTYRQNNSRRAQVPARRLDPQTFFRSGPIIIGEFNPFGILNPDVEAAETAVHALQRALAASST